MSNSLPWRGLRVACLALAALLVPMLAAAQDAGALRSRHGALQEKFASNQFLILGCESICKQW